MILWGMRAFGTRFLPKRIAKTNTSKKTEKETAVRRLFLYLTKKCKNSVFDILLFKKF